MQHERRTTFGVERHLGRIDVGCVPFAAEAHDADAAFGQARVLDDEIGEFAVRREECDPFVVGQGFGYLGLCAGDVLARAEVFEMRGPHVRDDRALRPCDGGKAGDLAPAVHAHFDDKGLAVLGRGQDRERKAELVVEIALGGFGFEAGGKDLRRKSARRGLAHRPRHAHDMGG